MISLALSSVSLSFGRTAVLAIASTLVVAAHAQAQDASGWPSNNIAVRGDALPAGQVVDLRCGISHAIALLKDGTLFLRGTNSLSNGFACNMPGGCDFVAIAAGYRHSLALRADGSIVGAGSNASGELTPPAWLTDAVSLAAGDKFSGALRANGTIVLWGSPAYGKTVAPQGLTEVVKLSLGQDHGMALRANGHVHCWGRNTNFQAPAIVIDPATGAALIAKDIAAGDRHSVAIRANGTVYAWGLAKSCNVPVGLLDGVAVAAGPGQSVVLRANGSVAAWGSPRMNPPAFNNAVRVAAGRAFGYALTDSTGIQAPAVTGLTTGNASSCTSPTGSIGLTIEDAPIRWWTGPNGFFSTREDLTGLGFGTYTLHMRGAGGESTAQFLVDAPDAATWFTDADGDGFGSQAAGANKRDCAQPEGMVANSGDCNDSQLLYIDADGDGHGSGQRTGCGGSALNDDGCDGNEHLLSEEEFYADTDADGFGDPEAEIESCEQTPPEGYVSNDEDCNDEDSELNPETVWFRDIDGDGVGSPVGGTKIQCERPEGYFRSGNDNCPLNPDLTDPVTFCYDGDHDNYGDSSQSFSACSTIPPIGYSTNCGDCNDGNASINPGASETCNGTDDDCDTVADDGLVFQNYYADADADGYGDKNGQAQSSCAPVTGKVSNNGDCNDMNDAISPGDPEICDPMNTDENCNGVADNADATATGTTSWYADNDGDGYGAGGATFACDATGNQVANSDDCVDNNAAIKPGAAETCDGIDQDCDGSIDDGLPVADYYPDLDLDTFGDKFATAQSSCAPVAGKVTNNSDCNDANASINPNGTETCDGVDQDCDGSIDDGLAYSNYYTDFDGDNFGSTTATAQSSCAPVAGKVTNNADCNDANASINPNGTETCDGVDQDCDGSIDDGLTFSNYYTDADNDGYGDKNATAESSCAPVAGKVTNNTDCNDNNAAISPGDPEICDAANTDEDCDGVSDNADDSATGKTAWYADADGDLFGAGAPMMACDATGNQVASNTDCNDGNPSINPNGQEVCDAANTDEDCDGVADNNDSSAADAGKSDFYVDADGDGSGSGAPSRFCDQPAGYSANANDNCPQEAALLNPVRYYYDADNDGYGNSAQPFEACSTTPPIGYRTVGGDCNDNNAAINPGAQEVCDAGDADEDCDGLADNSDPSAADAGKSDFYVDADNDNYGAGSAQRFCDEPAFFALVAGDCNDNASAINPGAQEVCDTGNIDEDCDTLSDNSDPSAADAGKSDFYTDADNDNYGTGSAQRFCDEPALFASVAGDCDDNASAINPGAQEVCDAANVDEDCDNLADNNDPSAADAGKSNFYVDADNDNYGAGDPQRFCDEPALYAPVAGDCNDTNPSIKPGAIEACDGVDQDCDGSIDEELVFQNYYTDSDNDGYGDKNATAESSCAPVAGKVTNNTDCNDNNAAISPGDPEICDAANTDEDCDGVSDNADDSATGKTAWYADADGDLFGAGAPTMACDATGNQVASNTDCNDGNPSINPNGQEVCDAANTDEDCDGVADNNDSSAADAGKSDFYVDADGDGSGSGAPSRFCDQPAGYSANANDNCPQEAALLNPVRYYYDADNDGYGNSAQPFEACSTTPPIGYRTVGGDCNDNNAAINPGAQEVCDAGNVDEDCDNLADNSDPSAADAGKSNFYVDADNDNYGAGSAQRFCDEPAFFALVAGDCNDNASAINPGAQEVCDTGNIDEDCDTLSDNSDPSAADAGKSDFYTDADNDNYGTGSAQRFCDEPALFASVAGDCDDNASAINPGAQEVCDAANVDEDCDNLADNNDPSAADAGKSNFYVDADGDTYGAGTAARFCDQPTGYSTLGTDCNDDPAAGGASVYPGAAELCATATVDNNCDGVATDVDANAADKVDFYRDSDNDGFTTTETSKFCSGTTIPGWRQTPSPSVDCDDANGAAYPNAPELCATATVDNDCDGVATDVDADAADKVNFYRDADLDTYTTIETAKFCAGTTNDGWRPAVSSPLDCNDTSNAIYPGAAELCATATVDNDCDGVTDEVDANAADKVDFYRDADLDTYTTIETAKFCPGTTNAGWRPALSSPLDCNDSSNAIYPGAVELCATATVDNDCDGVTDEVDANAADKVDFYRDADLDTYTTAETAKFCPGTTNAGWRPAVSSPLDCNDTSNTIYPGAAELCATATVDNDCDGVTDDVDANAADKVDFYRDSDGDGYTTTQTEKFCPGTTNAGWRSSVSSPLDCNDNSNAIYPGAAELCATALVDNDCDGMTDDVDANAADKVDFYRDSDSDSFTTTQTEKFCPGTTNAGWRSSVSSPLDCNDNSNAIYPGAAELCATVGIDNNCDTNLNDVDENAADKVDFYRDADLDTYTTTQTKEFCPGTTNEGWRPAASSPLDCNDNSNTTYPGAAELCSNLGIDNDCDGVNDAAEASDAVDYYLDSDSDGFGAIDGVPIRSCSPVAGRVPNSLDCDDSNKRYLDFDRDGFGSDTLVPCGGVLNTEDCDDALVTYDDADNDGFGYGTATACGIVTNSSDCYPNAITYADADGDGFGFGPMIPCGPVSNKLDCDDNRVEYGDQDGDGFGYGSKIACNGVLNNADCDDNKVLYADLDNDGFGAGTPKACGVETNSDCNDASNVVYPGALENCANDGTDNDCDGEANADAEAVDSVLYYTDADSDGFGTGDGIKSCSPVPDRVPNNLDCDDDAVIYADNDGDGYGAGPMIPCNGVPTNTDCNDVTANGGASVYPGALENCANDGIDNDCDGEANADAEAVDSVPYYVDSDADGYGAGAPTKSCSPIFGSVTNDADCDDLTNLVYPGALENCANDGIDNDCDGEANADSEAVDSVSYFVDGDADGFGAGTATKSCSAISGSVTNNSDCDDAAVTYQDGDSDSFGSTVKVACNGVSSNTDCDDSSNLVYPGALENCANLAVDNDCDGSTADAEAVDSLSYYVDGDSDTFGSAVASAVKSCSAISGSVLDNTDCDDSSNLVYPGALENCANDGIDNDCDGEANADSEAVDSVLYYIDADSDGFGTGDGIKSCTTVVGRVPNNLDCDDDAVIYADNDGDGYGAGPMIPCNGVLTNTDCNDVTANGGASVYPGALENCANDGIDNDCDGEANDDAEAVDSESYFVDSDSDGFGYGSGTKSCTPISGSVTNDSDCYPNQITYADNDSDGFGAGPMVPCGTASNNTDCNDSAARTYPGATEVCGDGIDNDCNGIVDDVDCVPFELSLESGTTSIQWGTPVVVTAVATAPPKPLRGMQLVVSWDTTALQFVGVLPNPDSPFADVVGTPVVDEVAGTLQYMLVASPDAPSMTTEAVLCDLAFTALGSFCDQPGLVRFAVVEGFGTEFASISGGAVVPIVPILTDLGVIDVDAADPVLSVIPPFSSVIPADSGRTDGALVAEPLVTATDDCADAVLVVSNWPDDNRFPIGSTVITWTATDSVGNVATAQRTITVGDFQLLDLSVELGGTTLPPNSPRQIRVTVQGNTVVYPVVFNGPSVLIQGIVVSPASINPGCISVKDPVHSLAKSASASPVGVRYAASAVLRQGDSNDDNKVDIWDYALWESALGATVAADAQSNFNGDFVVDLLDRAFVVQSVWQNGETCGGGFAESPLVTRISVKELRRLGFGHLAVADRNRDGWVDVRDVQLPRQAALDDARGN